MKIPGLSIIIPTLNEAATIELLIDHLRGSAAMPESLEIIVVDGGSTDKTIAFAKSSLRDSRLEGEQGDKAKKATVLSSPKGRAKQMNAGAAVASHDILYFLHADSFPPENFDHLIYQEIGKWNLAGCFRMRFDSNHWWLRLASWLTQFSWRACRGGDQSQFITKKLFEELGGFDETFIVYEDNDLINKLYAIDEFVVINKQLTTSARRYRKNGTWKLQYHFGAIYLKKWFGASAQELHEYYQRKIA